ncbi:MAG: ATP-dependent Clp protease adaptor ClpS [Planctomycetota bacterium]
MSDEQRPNNAVIEPDGDGAAVAVEVERKQKQGTAKKKKPALLPPYQVVLLDDDDHTYEYVIEMLLRVFRLPVDKAVELTARVDTVGRARVWSGSKEVAELKRDQVRGYGPDFYASQTVRYPLGCVIEPTA